MFFEGEIFNVFDDLVFKFISLFIIIKLILVYFDVIFGVLFNIFIILVFLVI